MVGDPKPNSERTLNDRETVAGWVEELAGPYDYLPWTDCGNCTLVRGPSWAFFNVTVWSGGGCLMLIIATALWLWLHGYLRS